MRKQWTWHTGSVVPLLSWLGLGLAVIGQSANAAIIPISQSRSISSAASAEIPPGPAVSDSDSASAPGFGLFDQAVSSLASVSISLAAGSVESDAEASQTSDHDAARVTATGAMKISLFTTALNPPSGGAGNATGNGESRFEFNFTLDTASTYTLTGFVDTFAIIIGGAPLPLMSNTVLFENLDANTVLFETLGEDESFSLSGALPAGEYRLLALATMSASMDSSISGALQSSGRSEFSFDFQVEPDNGGRVPEPSALALLGLGGVGLFAALARRGRQSATRRPDHPDAAG